MIDISEERDLERNAQVLFFFLSKTNISDHFENSRKYQGLL